MKSHWERGKKAVRFGWNVKKCIISVLKKCLNRNLKMSGFWVVFEGENGKISHNILIIKQLLKHSEISENCIRRDFLSVLRNFIFSWLSSIYLNNKISFLHRQQKIARSVKFSFWAKISFWYFENGNFSVFFSSFKWMYFTYKESVQPHKFRERKLSIKKNRFHRCVK